MSKQKGEDREQDQKLAICFSKWERKNESDIIEKITQFIGDQTTTAGVAVNTSGHGYPIKRKKKKKKDYKVTEKNDMVDLADPLKKTERPQFQISNKRYVPATWKTKSQKFDTNWDIKKKGKFHGKPFKSWVQGLYENGCPEGTVWCKESKKCVNEENKYVYVVKKGKEFKVPNDPKVIKKYKDKGFEIKESYVSIDPYGKPFDQAGGNPAGSLKKRKLKNYELFSDKNSKLAEKKAKDYVKKNKIKKYKIKVESPGMVSLTIKESIYGATLPGHGIQGSGQTRAVGDMNQEVMNLKKPVKFNNLTGTFSPIDDFLDQVEEVTKKQLAMLSKKVSSQDKKAATYKKGQTVKHWKWGKGKIIDVGASSFAEQTLLTVKFPTGIMKRLPAHEFE